MAVALLLARGSHPVWGTLFTFAALGWVAVAYLLSARHWARTVRPRRHYLSTKNQRRERGDMWGIHASADLWRGRMGLLDRILVAALAWPVMFTIIVAITAP
jgi:hypothetical protein